MVKTKQREIWIDVLRGLAMFMVVLGHIYDDNYLYFLITGPIKMPLFYIVSGYTFSSDKNLRQFLTDLIKRLALPWIIFSLFPLHVLKYMIMGNHRGVVDYILSFLIGERVWFITSFFLTQCMVYIIHKCIKNNKILLILVSVALFIMGEAFSDMAIFKIWCTSTAMTGVLFVNMGYMVKQYSEYLEKMNISTCILGSIIYALLLILSYRYYPGETIDFHNVQYYNIPLCLSMCIIGAFVLIVFIKSIPSNKMFNGIAILGQNTLVVYLLHSSLVSVLRKGLGETLIPKNRMSFPHTLIVAIIVCMMATMISIICGYFAPCTIGARKKSNVRR